MTEILFRMVYIVCLIVHTSQVDLFMSAMDVNQLYDQQHQASQYLFRAMDDSNFQVKHIKQYVLTRQEISI